MSNAIGAPRNHSDVITARYCRSCFIAVSVALLLSLTPFTAYSACWEITLPDKHINATDVWQVRDSINGDAVLLGKSDDESRAIDIARVQSFTVTKNVTSGWPATSSDTIDLDIQMNNGERASLTSEMGLYYVADEKRHEVPLAKVISAARCSRPNDMLPILPPTDTIQAVKAAAVIVMEGSDILYGDIASDQLYWQTSYAKIGFKPAELKSIHPGQSGSSTGALETLAGDRLKGSFVDSSISFHLTTGQFIELPTSEIVTLDFLNNAGATRLTSETAD